jgi:hypothetical protein
MQCGRSHRDREATPVLLTRELDDTIRRDELAGIRCGIETMRRLAPDVGAGSIEVAGGLIAFTGIESPLSKAYGVAMLGPVTLVEVARITEFYESRGTTPRVFVNPLADPTLGRCLAAAGYVPAEYLSVLICDDLETHAQRDDSIAIARDAREWARASSRGFVGREEPDFEDDIAIVLVSSEGVCALEAREHDTIVATAAMDIRGESAALFAGSTMVRFRHRGWHKKMIRDRIARAREAGARFVRGSALPAGPAERNFQRCGFTTLYTRTLWERKLPDPPA